MVCSFTKKLVSTVAKMAIIKKAAYFTARVSLQTAERLKAKGEVSV